MIVAFLEVAIGIFTDLLRDIFVHPVRYRVVILVGEQDLAAPHRNSVMLNGLSFVTGHKALVDEVGELEQLLGIKRGTTDHAAKILQHKPPELVAVDAG